MTAQVDVTTLGENEQSSCTNFAYARVRFEKLYDSKCKTTVFLHEIFLRGQFIDLLGECGILCHTSSQFFLSALDYAKGSYSDYECKRSGLQYSNHF